MSPSRTRRASALALAILGGVAGLALGLSTSATSSSQPSGPLPHATGVLSRLDLSARQQSQIDDLREREREWIEQLQCALVRSEQDLRDAELTQPFDLERVSALVSSQAELIAYLRGTESRLIGEIAQLLTPDQGRRLSEIRAALPDAPDSSVLASLSPASGSCADLPVALPEPPARAKPRLERAPRGSPQPEVLAAA